VEPFDTVAKFWSKVDIRGDDECWPWLFKQSNGYGQFGLRDKLVYAHRFAYSVTRGPIPAGFYVCHDCDNPICANPRHLFAGTSQDNTRDAQRKGRRYKAPV